jgi:flagellar basal-body rod protein FlgG
MVAQQYNLDTIANNLSNVNTTAFKQQRAEFEDLTYQTLKGSGTPDSNGQLLPAAMQIGLGANYASSSSNFQQGPMQSTGNALDVAINGNGFFAVIGPNGNPAFTRDGSFKTDANGLLVTSDGYPIEPAITVPSGSTAVNIGSDGAVSAILPGSTEPTIIGTLTISMFSNPAGLTRIGQNLYTSGGASGEPTAVAPGEEGAGTLQSTYLEGSNVQVVDEMVRMIMAQRAYEVNSKAIQTADDMLSVLNNLIR